MHHMSFCVECMRKSYIVILWYTVHYVRYIFSYDAITNCHLNPILDDAPYVFIYVCNYVCNCVCIWAYTIYLYTTII